MGKGSGRLRGEAVGFISEIEVIDGYVRSLCEELDRDNITHEVMETRVSPGLSDSQRLGAIAKYRLVLECRAGFAYKPGVRNMSQVFYGPGARDIGEQISESIAEWGQCFVWGHRTANPAPSAEAMLNKDDCLAVGIEPFAINGPDAAEYARRLDQLGTAIGRVVSGYLSLRAQARSRGVAGAGG